MVKITYQCLTLNALKLGGRVRNPSDAARIFAHRIARKMFGTGGRCFCLSRISKNGLTFLYEANIGIGKMQQAIHIPVVTVRVD